MKVKIQGSHRGAQTQPFLESSKPILASKDFENYSSKDVIVSTECVFHSSDGSIHFMRTTELLVYLSLSLSFSALGTLLLTLLLRLQILVFALKIVSSKLWTVLMVKKFSLF
jgi:hypothetical protein